MRSWILSFIFILLITGCNGIDPTWIWDLIKLVKDVSKIAESVNDIKGVSLTNDIYTDLQRLRKQTERGLPDLKWTILQQRYDQVSLLPHGHMNMIRDLFRKSKFLQRLCFAQPTSS